MNRLIILLMFCGMVLPVAAQMVVPLQLDVKPVTRKKGLENSYFRNTTQSQRALQITVQNTSVKPVTDVMVRWGIVKTRNSSITYSDSSRNWRERAFGAEEKFDLKPREQKIIVTDEIGACRTDSNFNLYSYGEKITGHGVQVLIAGKIVAEAYVPGSPATKKAMEKIYPVETADDGNRTTRSKP